MRRLIALLSLPFMGCALSPSVPVAVTAPKSVEIPHVDKPAGSASQAAATPVNVEDANLPRIDLSAEHVLRFLVGDIAAQRGEMNLATAAWMDLAKSTRDPRIAKRTLELALSAEQPQAAMDASRIWIETAPQSEIARRWRITLLIRANQLASVEALIPGMDAAQNTVWAEFFLTLHQLWDRQTDPAAMARLTLLLTEKMTALPEAHFARAVMYAGQQREADALAALDAALQQRAWWEDAVLYKAQLLGLRTPPTAAADFLRLAVDKNPQQLSFSLALARVLLETKRNEEADAVYKAILNGQPEQAEALLGSAELALQKRDFNSAYSMIAATLKQSPRNPDLLRYYLGYIEEERGNLQQALGWYQQVTGEEQRRARAQIPSLLAKLGQRDAAFQALAEIQPADEAEKIGKIQLEAQLWRTFKDLAKSRAVLTAGLQAHPNATDLYYDRSIVADLLHDVSAAEADLRHALQLKPESASLQNALGYVLANHNIRLDEAEVLLHKAIAQDPNNPTIIDSLGWLRFRQGQIKEAIALLGRAHGMMPDAEISAHYAEALWLSGDQAGARKILEQASQRNPDSPELLDTRKRLGL